MSSKGLGHWPNGKVWVVVVALLCLVLSQCRNHTDEAASLALIAESRPGCTAPCWLGVVPGVSTEAAVVDVIEANPERFADPQRNDRGLPFVQYIWRDGTLDALMSLDLENDVVNHITLQTAADLSLPAVLAELSPPDAYATYLSTGERSYIVLYLFYTALGITVETHIPPDQVQIVECRYDLPDAAASQIIYLTPAAPAQVTIDSLPLVFRRLLSAATWSGPNGLVLTGCP